MLVAGASSGISVSLESSSSFCCVDSSAAVVDEGVGENDGEVEDDGKDEDEGKDEGEGKGEEEGEGEGEVSLESRFYIVEKNF